MTTRALLATISLVAASLASARPAAAQAPPPPPELGDFAFVSPSRTLLESRFGASLSAADLRDRNPTHVDGAAGHLAFDWNMGLAGIGDATGLLLVLGMGLDMGASLGRTGDDLALGDFIMNMDATAGFGVRQDLAIETYLYGYVGYRAGLLGQIIYLEDDLLGRMFHLAYLHAGFRHELLAFETGAGYGAGGGHFHAGARLWLFDEVWLGVEGAGWFTPGERELWIGRAFFALRQE